MNERARARFFPQSISSSGSNSCLSHRLHRFQSLFECNFAFLPLQLPVLSDLVFIKRTRQLEQMFDDNKLLRKLNLNCDWAVSEWQNIPNDAFAHIQYFAHNNWRVLSYETYPLNECTVPIFLTGKNYDREAHMHTNILHHIQISESECGQQHEREFRKRITQKSSGIIWVFCFNVAAWMRRRVQNG